MKRNLRIRLSLMAAGIFMAGAMSASPAFGYFSATADATGGGTPVFRTGSRLIEEAEGFTKTVQIENANGALPVYVRVRVFSDDPYVAVPMDLGGGWSRDESLESGGNEQVYVYRDPVAGGASTPRLKLAVRDGKMDPATGGRQAVPVSESAQEGDAFNVIVLYESVAASYDGDGKPYADWQKREVER